MEQITLDLIPNGSLPVLHASQYDDGRQWKVHLKENGEDYTLSNETIVLDVRKGDGCAVTCAVAIESGKKYVILTSTEQMCAVAGQNLAELQITKDNTKIGTLNFILQVERDPLGAGIGSQSQIHDLQHQVDECVHTAFETIGASGLPYDNTESGLTADNVQAAIDEVNEKASGLPSDVYTKAETDALLADKADKATLEADYYDKAETDALLSGKADASALGDYYTKAQTDTKLSGKADKGSVYTTAQVNTLLGDKADKSDLDNYYTKSQTNSLLNGKANKADVYDKVYINGIVSQIDNAFTDVNTALGQKANSADVYNKTYIDTALSAKANANAVYTKAETDAKVAGLIDDTTKASNKTWSSNKISDELEALLPVNSASGSIANFTTSLALPLVSLKASIVATESGSGTKSPTNPYTLGGFSNAVITNQSSDNTLASYFRGLYLGTHGFINLGSFTWAYSTEGSRFNTTTAVSDISLASNFTNLVANGYHTVSSSTAFSQMQNLDLKRNGSTGVIDIRDDSFGGNFTNFKNAMNGVYLIYELATPVTPTITPEQFQALCTAFGITATQTTLALGQTVYGGEIVLTKKASGYAVKLRVTHGYKVFDGTETFTSGSNNRFFYTVNDVIQPTTSTDTLVKSSHFVSSNQGSQADKSVWKTTGNKIVVFRDSTIADLTAWANFLTTQYNNNTPVQLVYELATPIEIDLTDASDIVALVGTNNVWSDTGDMEVRFKVGIQEYIDSKVSNNRSLSLSMSAPADDLRREEPDVREER